MLKGLMVMLMKKRCKDTPIEQVECPHKTLLGKLPPELAARYVEVKARAEALLDQHRTLERQQSRVSSEMDIIWDDIRNLTPERANEERTDITIVKGEPIVSTHDCARCTKFDSVEAIGGDANELLGGL